MWGESEQGSGRSFRRQAETESSGLCDDEAMGGFAALSISIQNGTPAALARWGWPPRPATSITRQGPIPSRAKRLGMGEEAQRRE